MPKARYRIILALVAMALVIGLASCGGDGNMQPVVVNPLDELGLTDTGTGTGGIGGGGGGGTGACVITVFGSPVCYQPYTQSLCQQTASAMGGTYTWNPSPTTCQTLGYTFCSSAGGYEVCM